MKFRLKPPSQCGKEHLSYRDTPFNVNPVNNRGEGGGRRKDLHPGSVRARRQPDPDIDKSTIVNCVDAKLRSNRRAREDSEQYRLPGVPYPMRTKCTDGGAREWSREEESEGIARLGDETASWTTGPIDNAGVSVTIPASDVA